MESASAGPEPRLGLFATAMLVMGGIVGSGIFMNPHVVAKDAPSSVAILAAWLLGGAVALAGGVVWAGLGGCTTGGGGPDAPLGGGGPPAAGVAVRWVDPLLN